jgi:hypothetical protein
MPSVAAAGGCGIWSAEIKIFSYRYQNKKSLSVLLILLNAKINKSYVET